MSYKLKTTEKKLILLAASNIKPDDENFRTLKFKADRNDKDSALREFFKDFLGKLYLAVDSSRETVSRADGFQSGCAAFPIPKDDSYIVMAGCVKLCKIAAQKRKIRRVIPCDTHLHTQA